MSAVSLIRLRIENLGPIAEDSVDIGAFTYFVGRNNAGKSHYLKAIELLLATRSPSKEDIVREGLNKSCRRTPRKLQSLENGHTEARW